MPSVYRRNHAVRRVEPYELSTGSVRGSVVAVFCSVTTTPRNASETVALTRGSKTVNLSIALKHSHENEACGERIHVQISGLEIQFQSAFQRDFIH